MKKSKLKPVLRAHSEEAKKRKAAKAQAREESEREDANNEVRRMECAHCHEIIRPATVSVSIPMEFRDQHDNFCGSGKLTFKSPVEEMLKDMAKPDKETTITFLCRSCAAAQ